MTAEHPDQGSNTPDAVSLLRAQVNEVHRRLEAFFDQTLETRAPARQRAVALYVHAATIEDMVVHRLLLESLPLFATTWAGRGPALYSIDNLAPLRSYAADVYAATNIYLDNLSPAGASRTVDLTTLQEGHLTVAWVVSRFVVLEVAQLCGELASAVRASKATGS